MSVAAVLDRSGFTAVKKGSVVWDRGHNSQMLQTLAQTDPTAAAAEWGGGGPDTGSHCYYLFI